MVGPSGSPINAYMHAETRFICHVDTEGGKPSNKDDQAASLGLKLATRPGW